MVILKEIYSNTGLFDKVIFKKGLNIVLGKYSNQQTMASGKEINGIGKSTLIRLIDYCLLSDGVRRNYFNLRKMPFLSGHSVSLRFSINNIECEITRYFDKPNKILFVYNNKKNTYREKELKHLLGDLFFKPYPPTYYESLWFRSLIKFFIKDDMSHKKREEPYNFVSSHTRKNKLIVYNLYLFGLPNEKLNNLENYNEELEEVKKEKNRLIESLQKEYNKSIDELKSFVIELKSKVKNFEKIISKYDFEDTFKDLEDRLIVITREISDKLSEIYKLEKKLEKIKESYKIKIEVNIDEVVKYYENLSQELGYFLKKKLEEIIEFRKAIAENRKKYLTQKERQLQNKLDKLWAEYLKLEKERKEIYQILDSKGKFDTLKNFYEKLVNELAEYQHLINSFNRIEELEEQILQIEEHIESLYFDIRTEMQKYKDKVEKINKEFIDIVKRCTPTYEGSYLLIETTLNKRNPISIKVELPKTSSLGRNMLKILLYDINIFRSILEENKPTPHFLIHDGVFHGIDDKTKIRTLNFIYELLTRYKSAQYIITLNEDEIPDTYEDESLKFNYKNHTIAIYEDKPEKMIFKREF